MFRSGTRGAVALLVAGVLLLLPAVATAGWSAPSDLSAAGASTFEHDIAAASDGAAHAIWSRAEVIQWSTRAPGGTWSTGIDIPGATGIVPRIAVAANGTVHAIWIENIAGGWYVRAATRPDGAAWTAPVNVSPTAVPFSTLEARLTVAPDGEAHAAWIGGSTVQVATGANDGTWAVPVDFTGASSAQFVDVAVAPSGAAHATWTRSNGTVRVVQTVTRPAAGAWTAPSDISSATEDVWGTTIEAAADGVVHAAWFAGSPMRIRAAVRTTDGTWSTPHEFPAAFGQAQAPDLAVTPDGTAHAVWMFNSTITASIRPAGGTWTVPQVISSGTGQAQVPKVAATPDGTVHVVWRRMDGTSSWVQSASRPPGLAWKPQVDVIPPSTNTQRIGIATGGDSSAHAIWYRSDGTHTRTQVASRAANAPVSCGATATVTTAEDTTSTAIDASCADADGIGTATITDDSPDGTVAAVGDGTFSFAPRANFNGVASFTVTVADGDGSSDTIAVTATVTAVNDAPACPATFNLGSTAEDTPTPLANPSCTDVEGDTLAFTSDSTRGSVSDGAGDAFVYTPNANVSGTDAFTLTVSDGVAADTIAVSISVTAVNDAPTCPATLDLGTTDEDTATGDVDPGCTDVDGTALVFTSNSTRGSVADAAADTFTYTPNANVNGADSFTLTASDGTLTDTIAVTVAVTAVNDAPACPTTFDLGSTSEDSPTATLSPGCTDVEGAALTFTSNSTRGSVADDAGNAFVYTPDPDANGADSFTLTVSDGTATDTIAASIEITPVNDEPTCATTLDLGRTNEDTSTGIVDPACSDVDGDALTFSSDSSRGTVSDATGNRFSYMPDANLNGLDSFTLTVSDGTATDAMAVDVVVAAINDAPTCPATLDLGRTNEDTPTGPVDPGCFDVEGDALTFSANSTRGGVTNSTGDTFVYVPNPDANGVDLFILTASDGMASDAISVTVDVVPVADTTTSGSAGDDTIVLGSGDETVLATAGNDSIDGGPGFDTLDLETCAAAKVDLANGTLTGCGGVSTIRGIERVVGSDRADTIRGDDGNNVILGGGGDDLLMGGHGADQLIGGRGADAIRGGTGADRLVGGSGNDRLYGGAGNDRLLGNAGHDTLFGNGGRDSLLGGVGNDRLFGGAGRDHSFGGAGRDALSSADRVAGEIVHCGGGVGFALVDRGDRSFRCSVVVTRRLPR